MPTWLWEILISLGLAIRVLTVFIVSVAFGIFMALKVGDGKPWVAAAFTAGVLVFVVLPLRLWWIMRRSRG
jgi:hypothetical protein